MLFNELLAGELLTELRLELEAISHKSCFCKSSADNLITSIQQLLPIIEEIKDSGVERPPFRKTQLNDFSQMLRGGLELARQVLDSSRWNVYKNLRLSRKMEKFEKQVQRFISGLMQAHLLADVQQMMSETMKRFDRFEQRLDRLEQRLDAMNAGPGTSSSAGIGS
ncbi:ADR1-like 2, PHOENIX 21 [Hibiscus trionum]|uniref:ADR1-like 2, PHOENIX 21 n=1 Tax=Hibiscus trionum TaxID=183268 RepID=A0A9W7LHB7_HIBTR|nr:ADR1-like 2, PHOENIX 21 [Hibiscus trionum]